MSDLGSQTLHFTGKKTETWIRGKHRTGSAFPAPGLLPQHHGHKHESASLSANRAAEDSRWERWVASPGFHLVVVTTSPNRRGHGWCSMRGGLGSRRMYRGYAAPVSYNPEKISSYCREWGLRCWRHSSASDLQNQTTSYHLLHHHPVQNTFSLLDYCNSSL